MFNYLVWLLFSFKGRIGRLNFFAAWLGLILVGNIFSHVLLKTLSQPAADKPDPIWLLLSMALTVPYIWAYYAVHAKRLHDFNWSGWISLAPAAALFFVMVTWVMGAVAAMSRPDEAASTIASVGLMTLAALGLVFIYLVMLLFRAGTEGTNNYGPRPGPPADDSRDSDWSQRILDDPVAAAMRLRERDLGRAVQATAAPVARSAAAASGERVFGRRNARA